MKIAVIAAGRPRFTNRFSLVLEQIIQHNKDVDLYFYLWDEPNEFQKYVIETENLKIKKCVFEKEPDLLDLLDYKDFESVKKITLKTIEKNTGYQSFDLSEGQCLNWWEKNVNKRMENTYKQFYSLHECYKLVNEEYDAVIRIRLDGCLNKKINLWNYSMNWINLPCNEKYSLLHKAPKICDQFAFAKQELMKIYFDFYKSITNLILSEKCPIIHEETLLSSYFIENDIRVNYSDFKHLLLKRKENNV
jgi:hypothetical protein